MLQSKTVNTIRMFLSGRIRELAGRSLEGPVNPEMLHHLEDVTTAYADFTRHQMNPDDTETAFAALQEIDRGHKHLVEINKVFENGTGKGSAAHRFIQTLMSFTNHNTEVLTETAPNQ